MTSPMRVLAVIANYGMKNFDHAKTIAREYLNMDFHVDVVFLSDTEKQYGVNARVVVGIPNKNPWSLPFSHKKIFADHINEYDLFIYSEDDTLITQENIEAYLEALMSLDADCIPGFIRYEIGEHDHKSYPDFHGPDHWLPETVKRTGDYVAVQLSNLHSACYVLTRNQLKKSIESGGFLVDPHSGRYDMLCAAATDPYTQCGFKKVICISHLSGFEVHHLPNTYVGRLGLSNQDFHVLITALYDVLEGRLSNQSLFNTIKPIETPLWDMNYLQPHCSDVIELVPDTARSVLFVGCGSGETESSLIERNISVSAIPLDNVIGFLAKQKGIAVLPADFEAALSELVDRKFDAIILPSVLQHLADPRRVLASLSTLLNKDGIIIGSVPNSGGIRCALGKLVVRSKKWSELRGGFVETGFRTATRRSLMQLLRDCRLGTESVRYSSPSGVGCKSTSTSLIKAIACSEITFSAKPV